MILKFVKDKKNDWYIDLPEWKGRKSALQMVSGADTLLDYMSEGKRNISIYAEEEYFEGAECLTFIEKCWFNGAYYKIDTYGKNELNLTLWLCNVTKVVLGDFPSKIYFSKFD